MKKIIVIQATKFVIVEMLPILIRQANIFFQKAVSREGACSHAFTMDLSSQDFHAMILYDLLRRKCYQE